MVNNKIKRMIKEGKVAYGSFLMCDAPDLVEVYALSGFDFLVIDNEHGPLNIQSSQHLIRTCELRGMTPIMRVTNMLESTVLRSLDIGAHGVQVPQVNDKKTAEMLVEYAKYAPRGNRGIAFPRAGDYGMTTPSEYFEIANGETMLITHCENTLCLENLEEICAVPDVDVIFLGPYDMSQSMGIRGQVTHQRIEEAAEYLVKTCRAAGKAAGIFAGNGEAAKKRADQGFQYVTIGMDVTLFANVCRAELAKTK